MDLKALQAKMATEKSTKERALELQLEPAGITGKPAKPGGSPSRVEHMPKTMTRKDLRLALRDQGFSIAEAGGIINAIFSSIGRALHRGEQVHTPIGSFHRDRNGSKCVTHSLEGEKHVRRRLVHRRPAIHYDPDPRDGLETVIWTGAPTDPERRED